jgi:hypothetical protein
LYILSPACTSSPLHLLCPCITSSSALHDHPALPPPLSSSCSPPPQVRANGDGSIGFVKDKQRLCVSISRCIRQLVVIGDHTTLAGYHTTGDWAMVIQRCKRLPTTSSTSPFAAVVRQFTGCPQLQRRYHQNIAIAAKADASVGASTEGLGLQVSLCVL